MATDDSTFGIEKDDGRFYYRWRGTKSALIEAGICTADQFPEGRKRVRYIRDSEPHMRVRLCKGGIFEVFKDKTSTEVRRWGDRVINLRMLEDLQTPDQLREQLLGFVSFVSTPLWRYASGDMARQLAGTDDAPCWMASGDYQLLLDAIENMQDLIKNAHFVERKPAAAESVSAPAGSRFRLIAGGK